MGALKGCVTRNNRYAEAKNKLVNNVENFYKGREKIIKGFENKVFPLYYKEAYGYQLKAQKEAEEEEEKEEKRRKRRAKKEEQEEIFPTEFDDEAIQEEQDKKTPSPDKVIEPIINKEGLSINNELFKKHFRVESPNIMYNVLSETDDKEKNNNLMNIFNSGLKDLENEMKNMSKRERKTKKPNNIVTVVKKIS